MLAILLLIILVYYVGRPFYNLAEYHDKNKWVFGTLGVVSFHGAVIIVNFLLVLVIQAISPSSLARIQQQPIIVAVISLSFGVATVLIFYRILKIRWEKAENNTPNSSLDDDTILDGNLTHFDQN